MTLQFGAQMTPRFGAKITPILAPKLKLLSPQVLQRVSKEFWWCAWWVWLGILSSVGLGTGLHTFLLYLGPHIASVTMAAYSCNSVNFPSPPYPEE